MGHACLFRRRGRESSAWGRVCHFLLAAREMAARNDGYGGMSLISATCAVARLALSSKLPPVVVEPEAGGGDTEPRGRVCSPLVEQARTANGSGS